MRGITNDAYIDAGIRDVGEEQCQPGSWSEIVGGSSREWQYRWSKKTEVGGEA